MTKETRNHPGLEKMLATSAQMKTVQRGAPKRELGSETWE